MRVIVTGCRHWDCHDLAREVVRRLIARHGPFTLIHGAAPGVDTAFATAAIAAGCTAKPFPADWDHHGKKAGPLRNQSMVDAGAPLLIAVHRDLPRSRGTRDCVQRALKANIPCWLLSSDQPIPTRIKSL